MVDQATIDYLKKKFPTLYSNDNYDPVAANAVPTRENPTVIRPDGSVYKFIDDGKFGYVDYLGDTEQTLKGMPTEDIQGLTGSIDWNAPRGSPNSRRNYFGEKGAFTPQLGPSFENPYGQNAAYGDWRGNWYGQQQTDTDGTQTGQVGNQYVPGSGITKAIQTGIRQPRPSPYYGPGSPMGNQPQVPQNTPGPAFNRKPNVGQPGYGGGSGSPLGNGSALGAANRRTWQNKPIGSQGSPFGGGNPMFGGSGSPGMARVTPGSFSSDPYTIPNTGTQQPDGMDALSQAIAYRGWGR